MKRSIAFLVGTLLAVGCMPVATTSTTNRPVSTPEPAAEVTPQVDVDVEVTIEPDAETPAPEPPDQPIRHNPGDSVALDQDGEAWATIRVDRVRQVKRYNGPYDLDDVPKKGHIYIELRVTYVAQQDGVSYNPFDWQVFVDGVAVDDYAYVSNGPEPQLGSGTLPKGRKASGYLVYEVPIRGKVLFSFGSGFSDSAPVFEVELRAK